MQRAQNTSAYVNSAFRIKIDKSQRCKVLEQPSLVFGGINSSFVSIVVCIIIKYVHASKRVKVVCVTEKQIAFQARKEFGTIFYSIFSFYLFYFKVHAKDTEEYLYGKNLSDSNTINVACTKLLSEVEPDYDPPRASPQYRRILAVSLFYKVRILKFRIIKSSTTSFYLSGHWYCESVQILFSDFHCVHCFRVCQIYSKKKNTRRIDYLCWHPEWQEKAKILFSHGSILARIPVYMFTNRQPN